MQGLMRHLICSTLLLLLLLLLTLLFGQTLKLLLPTETVYLYKNQLINQKTSFYLVRHFYTKNKNLVYLALKDTKISNILNCLVDFVFNQERRSHADSSLLTADHTCRQSEDETLRLSPV